MNLKNKPLLSICIPTFNRCDKVFELVSNILNYQGTDIEVVVVDNCSSDNTKVLLEKIHDFRFKYILNTENIGGVLNVLKVITESTAEYSFLCLDKDYIDFDKISNLIKCIRANREIIFGYCSLNLAEEKEDEIYEKGFNSVLNMAFLAKHPSGYFYKTEFYKSSKIVAKLFKNNSRFEFNFELINAEMSFEGRSMVINTPLFYTEKKSDCAKVPSFTYSKSNLYFEPLNRFKEYLVYVRSISGLSLSEKEKYRLVRLLYLKALSSSTIGYKGILADESVCLHHGIATRKIGISELIQINIKFTTLLHREDILINGFGKFQIWFLAHLKVLILLLGNYFKGFVKVLIKINPRKC